MNNASNELQESVALKENNKLNQNCAVSIDPDDYDNIQFEFQLINEQFVQKNDNLGESWVLMEDSNQIYLNNQDENMNTDDYQENENIEHKISDSLFTVKCEEIIVDDQMNSDDIIILDEETNQYLQLNSKSSDMNGDQPNELYLQAVPDNSDNPPFRSLPESVLNLHIISLIGASEESVPNISEGLVLNTARIIERIAPILVKNSSDNCSDDSAADYDADIKLLYANPTILVLKNFADLLNVGSDGPRAGGLDTVYVLSPSDVPSTALCIETGHFRISIDNGSIVEILNKILKNNNTGGVYENDVDLERLIKTVFDVKHADGDKYKCFENGHDFENRHAEIKTWERLLFAKHKEYNELKQRYSYLKGQLKELQERLSLESDIQIMENTLSKYLEKDAVQFFINQMKVSGKKCGAYRWSDQDKLFALSILYKNPNEYNVLTQRYSLPTIKTLHKFVACIKKAEQEDNRVKAEK